VYKVKKRHIRPIEVREVHEGVDGTMMLDDG